MKQVALLLLLGLIAIGFAFAAGDQEEGTDGDEELTWIVEDGDDAILPGVNPIEVTGNIVVAG
ncbi:MAG: hypothetical protein ACOC2D_01120, partial [Spirochaetota bacterium]